MPALREELYRLIGLGFDPTKEITADTPCRNAAERAYRDAYVGHQRFEKFKSLVTGAVILVGTIVATAVTGGLAGPVAAMVLGTGLAAIQASVDIYESGQHVDRTLANAQAGLDSPESYDAAVRDATAAKVAGVLNVASGPLLAFVNGSAATPWFKALLVDAAVAGGTTALDARTWNGTTGDAAGSIAIAAVFGASGSVMGRGAHLALEGRHSPGMAARPESGQRIRLEIRKGLNEVRVVDEEGKLLRTARVARRAVDETGRPTNELVLEDTRPGHTNEVFTVALGTEGPMTEPGASPLEAAAPL
jgi:hypothetical protein